VSSGRSALPRSAVGTSALEGQVCHAEGRMQAIYGGRCRTDGRCPAAAARTLRRLRSSTGRSFLVSSLAGAITRKAQPSSGYSAILYAAPHITTARHSASPPRVSIVILRRLRRGRFMQGGSCTVAGRTTQYATLRMNELLSTNDCSVNKGCVPVSMRRDLVTTATRSQCSTQHAQ
jgi:hypothetical protein